MRICENQQFETEIYRKLLEAEQEARRTQRRFSQEEVRTAMTEAIRQSQEK